MVSYTLDDYANIIFNKIEYKLPEHVNVIFTKMITDLGVVATYTPSNEKSNLGDRDLKYKRSSDSANKGFLKRVKPVGYKKSDGQDDMWEKTRNFKTTVIEKKDGIDKLMNDIRISLNKISKQNYDVHRDTIIQYINVLITGSIEPESDSNAPLQQNELGQVANYIFDIASTNKFYSELYANLYRDLITHFPIFKEIINGFIKQYLDGIECIQYVDQNTNYDNYCDNNKLNDKRRAMAAFIVNLMMNDIITKDVVLDIIIHLQRTVLKYIDEPDKLTEVEEITENIFIFISMLSSQLSSFISEPNNVHQEKSNYILNTIKTCSQTKVKDHKSISSRTIFKYMDMNDSNKTNK